MSIKGRKAVELLTIAKFFATATGDYQKLENPIQQKIVEKLAEVLEVKSCIIFRTFNHITNTEKKKHCKLIAGVPLEEHTIGYESDVERHPDIKDAISAKEKFSVITDPKQDERCFYFKEIIERKRIVEILYIPLCTEINGDRRIEGVIVIDKMLDGGKQFDEEEIEFCCQIAEFLATIINIEQGIMNYVRDRILNPIVSVGGFLKQIEDKIKIIRGDVEIIEKRAREF